MLSWHYQSVYIVYWVKSARHDESPWSSDVIFTDISSKLKKKGRAVRSIKLQRRSVLSLLTSYLLTCTKANIILVALAIKALNL